ncbi:hypothetical protein G9464_02765 [Halostella sp. JP-L12]|uniref:hypothetical protein n=1 Tax=Halostella TaxID=1843185 RepID=UPI0013CE8F90|nr:MULTISPECIES: hypothetical protein [Halostella]NHN46519.1 hypothetical protein [Halostella sp. JP-L12]
MVESNKNQEGEGTLSRRTILRATGVGAAGAVGLAAGPGTAAANCPCEGVTLGKLDSDEIESLEEGETSTFELTLDGDLRIADDPECQNDKIVEVLAKPTEFKGNEVTCVELEIIDDNGACKCADDGLYLNGAVVKGGPEFAEFNCGDVDQVNQKYSKLEVCAPINDNNGKRYGISNITIEVCVFPNDKQTGGDCVNEGGG